MLPKVKALFEGGQQLYTKNSLAQGLFFIQRRNGNRSIEHLVTRFMVGFYQYRAYLTKIHLPLKGDRPFKAITKTFVALHPNLISTLSLPRQSRKISARLPRNSERLQLNLFDQLLSPQIMGLLGPKDI